MACDEFNNNFEYKNKFCVSILGYSFTWPHYAKNLALIKSYKTATGWQTANQNTRQNHIVCIVSKDVVQHLTRTLNSTYTDHFQRNCFCKTEPCTVQSVEVYCQRSLIATFTYVYKDIWCSEWHFSHLGRSYSQFWKLQSDWQIRQNYVSMA